MAEQPTMPPESGTGQTAGTKRMELEPRTGDTALAACHATFCRVTQTAEKIILDLGLSPDPVAPVTVQQRILLNRATAQLLAAQLQEAIKTSKPPLPAPPRPAVPTATAPGEDAAASPTLSIVWEGSQFTIHSFAIVNRALCLKLIERGHELRLLVPEGELLESLSDPRLAVLADRLHRPLAHPVVASVQLLWPPRFEAPPAGHWVIMQPWDYGSLPRAWIGPLNDQVDEIWVPSSCVRDCYVRSGVAADRVHVVPLGIDATLFRPETPPLALQNNRHFRFLFVGGTIARKGIHLLLQAYGDTFTAKDDVCLVIKDVGTDSFYRGQTAQDRIAQFQARPEAPAIEYIDRTLTDLQMAGLYTACDCLVHPYHGEGFGMPIAEAMASGLPVIITGHGGALDYCTDENSFLLPAREVLGPEKRIGDLETVDFPRFAVPDLDALKHCLRDVVNNRVLAHAKGRFASASIRSRFSWDQAAAAVEGQLQALRHQPVRRFGRRG